MGKPFRWAVVSSKKKAHLGCVLRTVTPQTGKDTQGEAWCRIVANAFVKRASTTSTLRFLKNSLYQHLRQEGNRYLVQSCRPTCNYGLVFAYCSKWKNREVGRSFSAKRTLSWLLPTHRTVENRQGAYGEAECRIVANLFSALASTPPHTGFFESRFFNNYDGFGSHFFVFTRYPK